MGTSNIRDPAGTAPASVATDALLVQAALPGGNLQAATALLAQLQNAAPQRAARVKLALSMNRDTVYAYILFERQQAFAKVAACSLESTLKAAWPEFENLRVSRLEKVFSSDGASVLADPAFHYVVEMDPEAGWMPELFQWYDTEHMPGLASVPGCVCTARFLNHDHGPLSLACYDLVSEETLGSAPWLAVRSTKWSDRMRPHFTNTIRTMFRYRT